jgi:uncharacterized protein
MAMPDGSNVFLFALDAGFNESDHPRDNDGKFGEGGGGSSASKPQSNLPFVRSLYETHGTPEKIAKHLESVPEEKLNQAYKYLNQHGDITGNEHDLGAAVAVSRELARRKRSKPDVKRNAFGVEWGGKGTSELATYPSADTALTFDRSSNRRKDEDGRLYVADCRLSKATVNPYPGRQIPGYEALGLKPDHTYQLWRHPDELAKAASTWNGIPLLSVHQAHSANKPIEDKVAGAIGTNCRFEPPYLVGDLVIWRTEDIEDVEKRDKCELSAAYYYRPEMVSGTTPQGLPYDGIMRDLRANHEALVAAGRAGPDVMVHDGKEPDMAEKDDKPEAADEEDVEAMDAAEAEEENAARAKEREAKASAEDRKAARDARRTARDAKRAADKKAMDAKAAKDKKAADAKAAKDRAAKDKAAKDKAARDKWEASGTDKSFEDWAKEEDDEPEHAEADDKAMDAAITAAVTTAVTGAEQRVVARMKALAQAREDVRPIVGITSLALDSAAAVYKYALDHLKVDTKDVPPEAYGAVLRAVPKAAPGPTLALDVAANGAIESRFPMLGRINQA